MSFSASIQGAMITRCISAGISASASTLLVLFILFSEKGLENPYSRIIFGLSLGDILQSLGMLISPFAAPSDPGHIFGMGSVESCEAIGFFFTVGFLVVPWYTLFLTYYFLKRVKYKLSPTDFAKREEKWLHSVIWTYSLAVGIYAVAKDLINPTRGGSICFIVASPRGCEKMEDVECVRGEGAIMASGITFIASLVTIFVALFVVLGAFTLHVYQSEKQLQPTGELREALTSLREKKNENGEEGAREEEETAAIKYAKQAMELKLTKSAIVQSSLYIVSFFFVYSAPCIAILSGSMHSETMFWVISIFLPLGGLFNMIIYTRPKVKAVRKVLPDLSRFIGFLAVLISGGETPNLIDIMDDDSNENDVTSAPPPARDPRSLALFRMFGIEPSLDLNAEIQQAMRDEGNVEKFAKELFEREENVVESRVTV